MARRLVAVVVAAALGVTGAVLQTAPASASTAHVTPLIRCADPRVPFNIQVHYTTSGSRLSVNQVDFYTLSSHQFFTWGYINRSAENQGWWDISQTPAIDQTQFYFRWPESLHVATPAVPYKIGIAVSIYDNRTDKEVNSKPCEKAFWA